MFRTPTPPTCVLILTFPLPLHYLTIENLTVEATGGGEPYPAQKFPHCLFCWSYAKTIQISPNRITCCQVCKDCVMTKLPQT